jgi:AraC-like DNA-binding protein
MRNVNDTLIDLRKRVNYWITIMKIYRDPSLTLYSFAKKLKTNTSYLSRVINKTFGTSFVRLINSFRVKDSIPLLIENKNIQDVFRMIGFNSRSSFNLAFKMNLRMTPSEFKYLYVAAT